MVFKNIYFKIKNATDNINYTALIEKFLIISPNYSSGNCSIKFKLCQALFTRNTNH